jgi:hypothetical protein
MRISWPEQVGRLQARRRLSLTSDSTSLYGALYHAIFC